MEQLLRPSSFAEYVGQLRIKSNLKVFIEAARRRSESLDHVLIYGPSGLGKTTLARIIAKELGTNIKLTSGAAIDQAGDLGAVLSSLKDGDVLFIDEIHRLPRHVEEVLYPAMEEFALDVLIGKGPSARTLRIKLSHFTLIAATTRVGLLSSPLRSRFGATYQLAFYNQEEMEEILERSSKILDLKLTKQARRLIAKASRQTPRVANRLLKRARDFSQVEDKDVIDDKIAKKTLEALGVDEVGLEVMDRRILRVIIKRFGGGPVGIKTVAAICGDEPENIEEVYEPYLLQKGYLERTPQGRMVGYPAYQHLGHTPPKILQQRTLTP